MNNLELLLIVETLRWMVLYDESNPDVGFGPFIEQQLQDICTQVEFNPNIREVSEILGLYNIRYGSR
jgi:hypothetical protein